MSSIACPACGCVYELMSDAGLCPGCSAPPPPAPPPESESRGAPPAEASAKAGPMINRPRIAGFEPAPRRSPGGCGIAVAVGLAVLAAFSFMVVQIIRQKGFMGEVVKESCRDNLKKLYNGLKHYEKEVGSLPDDTGSAFWQVVAEREGLTEELECAAAVFEDFDTDEVPYRGPSAPWKDIAPDGVIACDREKSHKDGIFVLFKDGRIEFAPKGGLLYRRALEETDE
jgi:hypothetical protein